MTRHAWAGDWALVTGASSGIGRTFAQELAAVGFNLVLVSRRGAVLEKLRSDLEQCHGIQAVVVIADLSEPGAAAEVHSVVSRQQIRVRLLCNNAAAGHWGPFEQMPPEECERIAYLTAIAPIALARWFLSDLATFPNSAIINVSSPAAYQPIPNLAAYAAAKACLHSFSLALYGEWAGRGVHVQTLVPGPTATAFDATAGSYRCAAVGTERRPPQEVVRASLAYLGADRPVVTTARGIFRQRLFAGLFPVKFVVRTIRSMFQPLAENS